MCVWDLWFNQGWCQPCPASTNKSDWPELTKGLIKPEAHLLKPKAGKMGGSPGLVKLRWRKVGVQGDLEREVREPSEEPRGSMPGHVTRRQIDRVPTQGYALCSWIRPAVSL